MIGQRESEILRPSFQLDDAAVYAAIKYEQETQQWIATVTLCRRPDMPLIEPSEVDVALSGEDNVDFTLLEQPTKPLVEVGGSLGTSSSGVFRFTGSDLTPTKLTVSYHGSACTFDVSDIQEKVNP